MKTKFPFRNSKRDKKLKSKSSTPGKQKAPCQINFMDRHFAKRSRSYKTNGYSTWCLKMSKKNGG